jgi:hypothetical protein
MTPSAAVILATDGEFYRVGALPKPPEHPIEVIDCKDEEPGIGFIEQHVGDFPHARDLAHGIFHVSIGLGAPLGKVGEIPECSKRG